MIARVIVVLIMKTTVCEGPTALCIRQELLKFKLTDQNSASGKNCAIRHHVNRFAVKGPESHLKDFVATFCQ